MQSQLSADFARDAIEHAAEGYVLIDREYRIRYLNDAAMRLLRRPDGLLGRTLEEINAAMHEKAFFPVLRRCLSEGLAQDLAYEHTFADGERTWMELRFQPTRDGVLVRLADISQRTGAERELVRARRVLAAIRDANSRLLEASSEDDFLQAVCDVAVRRGGYRLTWIASKEHDAPRSVRPRAVAGVDDGYTAGLDITWGDGERGRGPTGRALREGQPVVARFISTDADYQPWRERALARGYASSLCVPYRVGGEIEGALCVYSAEPDAFDEAETRALGELAHTLAHGLEVLRTRALARAHAERLATVNRRLERLAELMRALVAVRDRPTIAALVRAAGRELSDADGALVVWRDGDDCVYADADAEELLVAGTRVPLGDCVAGWVIRHRTSQVIADVSADPRAVVGRYRPGVVHGLALVPVQREQPIGAVGFYWHRPQRASDDDVRVLETLAHSIAMALDRVRIVDALAASEHRYRDLVENLEDVVYNTDLAGRFQFVSPSVRRYGFTVDELIGRPFLELVHDGDRDELARSMARTVAGDVNAAVFRVRDRRGSERVVRSLSRVVVRDGEPVGVTGVLIDITELRRAEEQLRVAQKMEAIGQLAGGVAHDFNNLLAVILAYADFVADALEGQEAALADLDEITRAGQRATALTRQLLAFSRKQLLEPQVLDLNKLAGDLRKMLDRLIGEDITIVQRFAPNLGRVKADPGQLEQVIMNLVVNARDAMPEGGTITIETANVELDHEFVANHASLPPGAFVVLSVSDTGTGMDEATRQRVFEPFFTTKGLGKGTGLGLSTVHGIVAQSGGSIWLDSRVGVGTTFKIFLPRVTDELTIARRARLTADVGGGETILVVEDDPAVRGIAARVLTAAGYHVLTAADGVEAAARHEHDDRRIDLLLTDVIMPQLGGKGLAERLTRARPQLAVLYMSGYTDSALERHGGLEPGMRFIGKPFSAHELRTRVREVLDAARATARPTH